MSRVCEATMSDTGDPCPNAPAWSMTLPDSNSAANIVFLCTHHAIEATTGLLNENQGVCLEAL